MYFHGRDRGHLRGGSSVGFCFLFFPSRTNERHKQVYPDHFSTVRCTVQRDIFHPEAGHLIGQDSLVPGAVGERPTYTYLLVMTVLLELYLDVDRA